jgi:aminoglycoside 6-adenylyltransferase
MPPKRDILALVLDVARRDERVRAVALNGSRANPNAPKDPFQDYDVVYIVSEMESFLRDSRWIDVFGERIILQTPEAMSLFPPELGGRFSYLMQFTDGSRIDLCLVPYEQREAYCREDSLTQILLDKDGSLPSLPPASDRDYWVKRPTPAFFADCCNEFWWVSPYVAKGLWRREMTYALDCLNSHVRPMLLQMLAWKVGAQHEFRVSVGKSGKYLQRYLPEEDWQALLATYPAASYPAVWAALFAATGLFRGAALNVAAALAFHYNQEEDARVSAFLDHIQKLPDDVTEVFPNAE